ncbi:uncharacterized protein LOC124498889 [Dermatophagoides farinae]|uniref:Uncharacterized protein n=1 Tax=Dermatophagoides farinae TaxID=6954 RepID=A0A922I045_DERFA|nr:uncharacterized protein LOC124498889 [Dermatophagoides farinae]KAH7645935.1 hypothetical protein HUG17_1473 [Dermatophagoides farinae]KAH9516212.1 hypothetical protein DERF_006966 [Dermatophagoides farinae]
MKDINVTIGYHTDYNNQTSSSFWHGDWNNVPLELLILILVSATITVLLLMLALYCLFGCIWRKYFRRKVSRNPMTSIGSFSFNESFSQSRSLGSTGKKRTITIPTTTATATNWVDVEIMLKMPNDAMRQLKREQTPIMRMIQFTRANRRQLINLGYSDTELESIGYYRTDILNKINKQLTNWHETVTNNSQQVKPIIHCNNQSQRNITFTSSEFDSEHSMKEKKLKIFSNKFK